MAYAPQPSFDDVAWYGLAYLRVYEMDKTAMDFFRVAKDIYRWIWVQGWDESGNHEYHRSSLLMMFSILNDAFVFQTTSLLESLLMI